MFQSFLLGCPKLRSKALPKHYPHSTAPQPRETGVIYIYAPLKTICPKPVIHPAVLLPMLRFKDGGIWMT